MSRYIDYFLYILIVLISSVFLGAVGFIVAIGILTYLINYRAPAVKPYVKSNTDTTSIRDAWLQTDRTKVPLDCYDTYRKYLASPEWRALRKSALKRDSYRCQHCGYIGDRLQVHHLSYDGIYTMNFHVDQLQTLCSWCHDELHSKMRR